MLQVHTFTFNPFEENTYVVFDETGEAAIVDPGCSNRAEEDELKKFIQANKLRVVCLLNTHCHVDHVLGNAFVKDYFKVPLLMHRADEPTLRAVKIYAPMYGIGGYTEALPDQFLEEGDTVKIGRETLKVLFLPGHAPGHIGFYHAPSARLLAGDVLFHRSIGRTDLPGGNFDVLIQSVHQKVFTLPDEVVVYPGHGPTTTVGEEKVENPFCALSLN